RASLMDATPSPAASVPLLPSLKLEGGAVVPQSRTMAPVRMRRPGRWRVCWRSGLGRHRGVVGGGGCGGDPLGHLLEGQFARDAVLHAGRHIVEPAVEDHVAV